MQISIFPGSNNIKTIENEVVEELETEVKERIQTTISSYQKMRKEIKIPTNYIELHKFKEKIGNLGEKFVYEQEYERLQKIGFELDPDSPTTSGFVSMVSVDVTSYAKEHFEKSVKKTLSIPIWLNKAALEQNINFSQVLQDALLVKLANLSSK